MPIWKIDRSRRVLAIQSSIKQRANFEWPAQRLIPLIRSVIPDILHSIFTTQSKIGVVAREYHAETAHPFIFFHWKIQLLPYRSLLIVATQILSGTKTMIQGFHHPGIVVPDLDIASDFYRKLLGFVWLFDIKWSTPHYDFDQIVGLKNSAARGQMLKGQNCYLELWEYTHPISTENPTKNGANDYGIRHLAFQVDDVQVEYERLKKLGGIVTNPPHQTPGGATAVYCRDPFGNIIEFTSAAGNFPGLEQLEYTQ